MDAPCSAPASCLQWVLSSPGPFGVPRSAKYAGLLPLDHPARGHSPDEIRRLAVRAASPRRRSSSGNSLCGQNSVGSRESARPFKGIICDDISEFESRMPRQAVGSPPATCECRSKPLGRTSASGRQPGFMRAAAHQGGRDRAMVPDADSRVDAYMCHETIKPVARDKGGVTGCDAFRLRGRPCRIIRNRVMSGRACIA